MTQFVLLSSSDYGILSLLLGQAVCVNLRVVWHSGLQTKRKRVDALSRKIASAKDAITLQAFYFKVV